MQSHTAAAVRRIAEAAIDTRVLLNGYAAMAIVIGITITGTGIRGIPGMPLGYASIIWIAGMAMVAAGCAARGLALNEDPVGRQRALRWFAVGHVLLGLFAWMQWALYWRLQGFPLPAALVPLLTGAALLAAAATRGTRTADDSASAAASRIRTSYDEHIRQIARREERARLARDLHDAVKQQLFVIQTAAATAQARLDEDRAGAREAVEQVRTAAREATTEMEALLDELQAAPMENTGLTEALKKQCEALALRTGASVSFQPGTLPPAGAMQPAAHDAIYRVAQEALANVARHARATHVTVSLHASPTRFELRVSDNGAGIDASAPRTGMGLANMEARATEIGGRLSIVRGSPGTDVVLSVPLTHPAVRGAWYSAAAFALLALSTAVFYGIRGGSPDQRSQLLFAEIFAVWVALRFAVAYRKAWREKWP